MVGRPRGLSVVRRGDGVPCIVGLHTDQYADGPHLRDVMIRTLLDNQMELEKRGYTIHS